jgi:hypothetical protein
MLIKISELNIIHEEEDSVHKQIRFRAKEGISEVLEHSFVWCGNLDSFGN